MNTTSNHPRSAVVLAARELRASAGAARQRSRRMLADDEARRYRMREAPHQQGGGATRDPDPVEAGSRLTASLAGGHEVRLARDSGDRAGERHVAPPLRWLHGDAQRSAEWSEPRFRVHSAMVAPSHVVVRVVGEVDIATAPSLSRLLLGQLAGATDGSAVDADLAAVEFLDAAGLRVLLTAAATARDRGTGFRILNCSPSVRRVLDLTGSLEALRVV